MNKKSLGRALITGGAKRLGASISTHLAKMGYDIVIHYDNSKKEAQSLQNNIIKNYDVDCQIIRADLMEVSQILDMTRKIKKDFKNWNLLVNSASVFHKSTFMEGSIDELVSIFNLHLRSAAILTKELASYCDDGNIINMIDKNITRHDTKYFSYLLSKKTLADFTKMVSLELAPKIRVNAIAPGFILNGVNEIDKVRETKSLITKIPLCKKGSADNIVMAVEYLLKNDFVTGEILFVDGGASLNHAG